MFWIVPDMRIRKAHVQISNEGENQFAAYYGICVNDKMSPGDRYI